MTKYATGNKAEQQLISVEIRINEIQTELERLKTRRRQLELMLYGEDETARRELMRAGLRHYKD